MSDTTTLAAPDLTPHRSAATAWEDERDAFFRLLPALLATHSGRYVALHKGEVVAEGTDQVEVARQAYARVGYVPVYVGRVTVQPERAVRLPSPKLLRPGGSR